MSKRDIIKQISRIISDAFINAAYRGVCLHCSILLWENLKKVDIESELICGFVQHINGTRIPFHFWVEVDGNNYDPTVYMNAHGTGMEMRDLVYYSGRHIVITEGDQKMLAAYTDIKNSNNSDKFWNDMTPDILAVRKKVNKQMKKFVKTVKTNKK